MSHQTARTLHVKELTDLNDMKSPIFRFAVIADSHIEPEPDGMPTRSNMRNTAIVHMLNEHHPDFVVHCGDILHVPAFGPHFDAAADVSKSIYRSLKMPIYSTPGNQDIGDKPSAWMPAPHANEQYTQAYERHYGPAWQCIVHKGCHFVFINSPIMNSGSAIDHRQCVWLDNYLEKAKGERIFLITHYPIFLLDENEVGHYDNIDEPARSWLIERIDRYRIEAVFAGHVHNFFYNRRKGTDYYILPSTAFVRRDYSELFNIEPSQEAEFGRNEPSKLGFMLIDVLPDGYQPYFVRSYGQTELIESSPVDSMPSPVFCTEHNALGVTLRKDWCGVTTLSANNTTDEFVRKRVRSDYALEGFWHLGIKTVRVFMDDLRVQDSRQRLRLLSRLGYHIHIQSAGVPHEADRRLMTEHSDIIQCWEIVLPTEDIAIFPEYLQTLPHQHMEIALAKFENSARHRHEQINYPHFLSSGFQVEQDEQLLSSLIDEIGHGLSNLSRIVFRTTWAEDPCDFAQLTRKRLEGTSLTSIITASWLPVQPGEHHTDDSAIAYYVFKLLAAMTIPGCKIVLDLFSDQDRGYYPRNGVVNQRYDPRTAGRLIRNAHRLFDQLEEPPQFVSSDQDEHGNWHARLLAGKTKVILYARKSQNQSQSQNGTKFGWMDVAADQSTMTDLLTGEGLTGETELNLGEHQASRESCDWHFVAVVGR